MNKWLAVTLCYVMISAPLLADPPKWLLGTAVKLPSETTNQESGYFSIIEGKNQKLYIGSAKYGVNGFLLEYDPKSNRTRVVMDVMQTIGSTATGFAAQAKIHTRNNVGESGVIYVGSKQGYPEKGESKDAYLGGYVLTHDPATGKNLHYGIPKPKHGVISVMPDESRGVVYLSTCSDDRPIDHTHFMMLNLKTKQVRDFGDMEQAYAFIVLDHQGRAYHPIRGGTIARYDPNTDQLERLTVTLDGKPLPDSWTKDHAILNWDTTRDRKTLYSVEMVTNELVKFDLTQSGKVLNGTRVGPILSQAKRIDCRCMCVGPTGTVWMAVTEQGLPRGPQLHLVSYRPGDSAPIHHGPVGVKNPDFTTFVNADGSAKPWHHTMRKEPDGILTPWQPLGICEGSDGVVNIITIAPFTLMRIEGVRRP
ncbi:SMP-30/gluconolactonase/LRE family protein [Tuwongella immobilis]|uniref:Uncharacterized protein n=1 Tax=Tuwongella immobilis TaxID=692036 RepID=A0A6C2YLY8_9BACT|nr:hypothetical protein [Tuwongella immobilis]VIP02600.1 unnamed protein product [Tuwongella immobilis]VTS01888.1 unnamed protein product [Tuwongella immobilis]